MLVVIIIKHLKYNEVKYDAVVFEQPNEDEHSGHFKHEFIKNHFSYVMIKLIQIRKNVLYLQSNISF